MTKGQSVYIIVQDPSLAVRASPECLGLFLCTDSEPLVVDGSESALDHCIVTILSLKYTLVQINVLHTHSLTIDYHIARNTLCHIMYHMLLINQTIHLRSESHKFCDAMFVVFVLENGSQQFLIEVEDG